MEFPSSDSMLMSYIMKNKYDAPRYLEKGRHLFFFGKNFLNCNLVSKFQKNKSIIDIIT